MINNEESYLKFPKFLQWVWLVIIIGVLTYAIYIIWIEKTSDRRYTVCTVIDHYVSKSGNGKIIEYKFEGKVYNSTCLGKICESSKIGDRFLIYLAVDDPTIIYIYTDIPVINEKIQIPDKGWISIPKEIDK